MVKEKGEYKKNEDKDLYAKEKETIRLGNRNSCYALTWTLKFRLPILHQMHADLYFSCMNFNFVENGE